MGHVSGGRDCKVCGEKSWIRTQVRVAGGPVGSCGQQCRLYSVHVCAEKGQIRTQVRVAGGTLCVCGEKGWIRTQIRVAGGPGDGHLSGRWSL